MMASLEPVATPVSRPVEPEDEAASAASLLDRGIRLLGDGDCASAADAFTRAIATGRLNDAGRVFAYWQVFVAYDELGDMDSVAQALASFVVVADELMSVRAETRFVVTQAGDFIDRFELGTKLRRARASLSAAWAQRAPHFGRSAALPVPVYDLKEMEQFLELVVSCDDTVREERSHREVLNAVGERVRQVTVTCGELTDRAEYYFALIPSRR